MMMRQALTKKRKGRRRSGSSRTDPAPAAASRPNLRPRRRCLVDYDEEEEEEEEERGRRKLKLVVKLSHGPAAGKGRSSSPAGGSSCPSSSYDGSGDDDGADEDEEEAVKPQKKRRIDSSVDADQLEERKKNAGRSIWRAAPAPPPPPAPAPGRFPKLRAGTPLPQRKVLEYVINKLQKKDIYSVFAQPVDPEELPDYHEVIEHQMDFGTIRKKLSSHAYSCFEQFEDDVFLVCSNAMQYNAPDTVYFRQARAIQEMALRKFQMLRDEARCTPVDKKPAAEQPKSSPIEKPMRKPTCTIAQDPVVSGISSASAYASAGDTGTGLDMVETAEDTGIGLDMFETTSIGEPVNANGSMDGGSTLCETKTVKADESILAEKDVISGKCSPSKSSERVMLHNDNHSEIDNSFDKEPIIEYDLTFPESPKCSPSRPEQKQFVDQRAAYGMLLNEVPIADSDTVLDVLDEETKHLVAVELHMEYAYARSLARFAGPLGPIVWRIAANKIEKALPSGMKFGPGWVGEHEPLPSPVFTAKKYPKEHIRDTPKTANWLPISSSAEKESANHAKAIQTAAKDTHIALQAHAVKREAITSSMELNEREDGIKDIRSGKTKDKSKPPPSLTNWKKDVAESQSKEKDNKANTAEHVDRQDLHGSIRTNGFKRMESIPNNPLDGKSHKGISRGNQNFFNFSAEEAKKDIPNAMLTQKSGGPTADFTEARLNFSDRFRAPGRPDYFSKDRQAALAYSSNMQIKGHSEGYPPNQDSSGGGDSLGCSIGRQSNHMPSAGAHISFGGFQLLANDSLGPPHDNNIRQSYNPENNGARTQAFEPAQRKNLIDAVSSSPKNQVESPFLRGPASRATTSGAWFHEKSKQQAPQYLPQPLQPQVVAADEPTAPSRGLVFFPQLIRSDLPRFHGQPAWQGSTPPLHSHQTQIRDLRPPDLNIGFHSPGSPAQQSAGILKDTQQPDLALQL